MTEVADPQQDEVHSSRGFESLRVPKTKSRPNNTLFGSCMEHITLEEKARLHKMNYEESSKVAKKYDAPRIRMKPELDFSESLADTMHKQARADLEEKKENFRRCQERLKTTTSRLVKMERQSHYTHPLDQLHLEKAPHASASRPAISPEASRVLRVPAGNVYSNAGLKARHNRLPAEHNYSLMGDVLRGGQEFDSSQPMVPLNPYQQPIGAVSRDVFVVTPRTKERRLIPLRMPPSEHTIPGSGLQIPANLRHKYGSLLVDRLLADKDIVERTQSRVDNGNRETTRKRAEDAKRRSQLLTSKLVETGCITGKRTPSPTYAGISTLTRSNVFPGASHEQFVKSSHRDYNPSVTTNRDPSMPTQYRYQTDKLGKWAEADVIQRRIMRAFDEKYSSDMQGTAAK